MPDRRRPEARAGALHAERVARTRAEDTVERIKRLQLVLTELAAALDADRIADVIVESGVAAVEAATGAMYLLQPDGRHARMTRSVGYAPEVLARYALISLEDTTPLAEAIRTRTPILLGTREDYGRDYPGSEGRSREVLGPTAAIGCLPLVAGGECFGGLVVSFDGPRQFGDEEQAVLSLLAHHCAQALHRARLLEQERRYHERLRILAEAGQLLGATLDYDTTLATIVRMAMPELADFGFLDVVEAGGEVRRICHAHDDRELQTLLESTRWVPSAREDIILCGLSSGRTGVHPSIDDAWMRDAATGPEHLQLLRQLGLRSMVTVPLVSQRERLGGLTLCFGKSERRYGHDDVSLIEELARRAAQAVRQARLYLESQESAQRAERAARHAEEASRLKDEFLATVSHELRTPLSAILGWSSLLQRDSRPGASLQKGLGVIERNARAQQRIIEDILDVSRIVRGELRIDTEPVDIETIALDVLDSLRPAATARQIDLVFPGSDGPCRVAGDSGRIRQILWNLLSNAVKFTPEGGTVSLSITDVGGRIVISVKDTGLGIDPVFLPHVFERFRQADSTSTRSHGGLGLGLAIVRHLTEMHGGTVTAESEGRGKGATFSVSLPVKTFARALPSDPGSLPHAARASQPAPAPAALAGARVLVVDDQHDARELIAVLLSSEGAEVRTAPSAEGALEELAGFDADLLVSDIGMPGRDGYWLIRQVRAIRPTLPAIALSAYSRGEEVERARELGFDQHIAKPVHPEKLVELIAACLGR